MKNIYLVFEVILGQLKKLTTRTMMLHQETEEVTGSKNEII
jgi:hypothetical protein